MKNLTLLATLILASITLQAQQTSFEDLEGYPADKILMAFRDGMKLQIIF
jgi:hypothetical protein